MIASGLNQENSNSQDDATGTVMRIDCYGHPSMPSQQINCEEMAFDFRFADSKSFGLDTQVAVFFDYSSTLNHCFRFPKNRRVAILTEPNASAPFVASRRLGGLFEMVLTHDQRLLCLGAPYQELPFGTTWVENVLQEESEFRKTKLLSMIGAIHANPQRGHVLRNKVLERMILRENIDVYGKGIAWIDSKVDGLAEYAFSIAMENCSQDYYFTEKLIDCFLTDTVPVYYGCPGIGRYFDLRGMLCFQTIDELERHLTTLSWRTYEEMRPFVRANREKAIRENWVTWTQLYERIAVRLHERFGREPRRARPTMFRILQDLYRRLPRRK